MPREGKDGENVFRWLVLGTEIPVMVFLGAFLGYEFGRRLGFPYEYVGLTLGAILGFAASILALFRATGALGKGRPKPRKASP